MTRNSDNPNRTRTRAVFDVFSTPLMTAAKEGDTEGVTKLLQDGAIIDEKDFMGDTALTHAVKSGKETTTKLLLDEGANVNAVNNVGTTALRCALDNDNLALTELLLDRGANINCADEEGRTALMYAAMSAAHNGNLQIVELLLNKGADTNYADKKGKTALMLALSVSHPAIGKKAVVEILLTHTANPNTADLNGDTVMKYAIQFGSVPIAELLWQHGADIESTIHGQTPLMFAVNNNNEGMVRFFLSKMANLNRQCSDGNTAVHYAISRRYHSITALLFSAGADAAIPNSHGVTPLMTAASQKDVIGVKLILNMGVDTNAITPNGDSAFTFVGTSADTAEDAFNGLQIRGLFLAHGYELRDGIMSDDRQETRVFRRHLSSVSDFYTDQTPDPLTGLYITLCTYLPETHKLLSRENPRRPGLLSAIVIPQKIIDAVKNNINRVRQLLPLFQAAGYEESSDLFVIRTAASLNIGIDENPALTEIINIVNGTIASLRRAGYNEEEAMVEAAKFFVNKRPTGLPLLCSKQEVRDMLGSTVLENYSTLYQSQFITPKIELPSPLITRFLPLSASSNCSVAGGLAVFGNVATPHEMEEFSARIKEIRTHRNQYSTDRTKRALEDGNIEKNKKARIDTSDPDDIQQEKTSERRDHPERASKKARTDVGESGELQPESHMAPFYSKALATENLQSNQL